ncbi:MAG: AI-2E family transporter [Bacilli bacterium]|nr:AI-2E family transporter [Bacilli bacterium]
MNKKEEKNIDVKKINNLVDTGNKILNFLYVLFIISTIYIVTLVLKGWGILPFIGQIIKIISPLFIGLFIAWLLNPWVQKLVKKGINKTLSVIIVYLVMFIALYLVFAFTLPSLGTQITDIVASIPTMLSDVKEWIDEIFIKLSDTSLTNLDSVKDSFLTTIENFATNIQTSLPQTIVNIVSSIMSGLGTIAISLIVGFYILFDYEGFVKRFMKLFPDNSRKEVDYLLDKLSETLYSFINGTFWLSVMLFIVSYIGFAIIGLNAPILIAFVCVITNLIPYIGPYIGAAVAAAIGFTQSPFIGIVTLIFILIVQMIEGNFLQPLVMSKKMNLSPVTILISLLLFSHFFGILGMVVATPIVAILKIIFVFFDEKYHFFRKRESE